MQIDYDVRAEVRYGKSKAFKRNFPSYGQR